MAKPTTNAGAAKPRQFRFTDEEVARIDAVARTLAQPGVPVSRMTVLRLAFNEFEARRAAVSGRD
jgi:hypothetical protein